MDDRGFDHGEVLECLRRGVAYGPEIVKGEQRANVVHRGLNIRVVVAGVAKMQHLTVVTVMEAK